MSSKTSPADPAKIIKPEGAANGDGDDAPQEDPIVKFSPEEEAVRQQPIPIPVWTFV